MLDSRTKALLLAVLYPVQFEQRPERRINRVVKDVVERNALKATPIDFLDAIKQGMESQERLSAIIPDAHSEASIRSYLKQLSTAIASEMVGFGASSIASTTFESPAIAGMAAILTKFATPAPGATVDIAAILNKLAASNKEKLDWQKSIVDLMKLLNLDSSPRARKELADKLHYPGDKNDFASMNRWLHKQVMKLAENAGKMPGGDSLHDR